MKRTSREILPTPPSRARQRDGWPLIALAITLAGCAPPAAPLAAPAGPRGQVTAPSPAPRPPLAPLPLPEDLRACTRHRDCMLGGAVRVVRVAADCARPLHLPAALNQAAWQRLEATAIRVCGPPPTPPNPCACGGGRPPTCCPPVAMRRPDSHAVCVRSRCEVRPGEQWTEDEQREDAAGRGTEDEGECYSSATCYAPQLTAFPQGFTDQRGRELCPVCPRPGTVLPDEAGRATRLEPFCPRRSCLPTTVKCERRRCVYLPQRTARLPVPALPPPPEPRLPEGAALPRGPDYVCARDRDCVVGPLPRCSCGGVESVNRRAAEQRRVWQAIRCRGMPCPWRREPDPPPVPVCFERMCTSRAAVAAARRLRHERARLLPAWQAWERQVAKQRASKAFDDEIETEQPR